MRSVRCAVAALVVVALTLAGGPPAHADNTAAMTFPADGRLSIELIVAAGSYEPDFLSFVANDYDDTPLCSGSCGSGVWESPSEPAGTPFDIALGELDGSFQLSDDRYALQRDGTTVWTFTRRADKKNFAYTVRLTFLPGTGPGPGSGEPAPANRPPVFTEAPQQVDGVFPQPGSFRVAAQDPDGGPVTVTWSQLPLQPVKVDCVRSADGSAATCSTTARSGLDHTGEITFTATDAPGARATTKVLVRPANYVALGDSFSSGEGAPPFDAGTDTKADKCHRSKFAWARYLDIEAPLALSGHFACSGALATNVVRDSFKTERPQTAQLRSVANVPELVTVSVGGNDVGFGDIILTCYLTGLATRGREVGAGPCINRVRRAKQDIDRLLPARLPDVYRSIGAQLTAGGRSGRVLVVGYPNIMATGTAFKAHCLWLSGGAREALVGLGTYLDTRIAQIVATTRTSGVPVSYVSTLNVLAGHELCTGDAYVEAIVPNGGKTQLSGHPTAAGQQRMRGRVDAAIAAMR